jgi:hypothetical protein
MGWDIYIGNAAPRTRAQMEEDDWTIYSFAVEHVENPDAPEWPNGDDWPDISGKSNHRAPGYSSFASLLRDTGITANDVPAFGARGSDGDCFVLRTEHRDAVRVAREQWQTAHPGTTPGWRDGDDYTLAKLIWYEWWMTWALENCERPAIQMS